MGDGDSAIHLAMDSVMAARGTRYPAAPSANQKITRHLDTELLNEKF